MKQPMLKCDLHTHTVASGHAFATVEELAGYADRKGLEMIAITDHGPGLPGGAHPYHFWNLRVLPRILHNVILLRGAEVNIIDSRGTLDMEEELLESLDVIGAGFHPLCGYDGKDRRENTAALLAALDRYPQIDILVHPGNTWYPIEPAPVVEAAIDHGVLIELNNSSFVTRPGSYENCLEIARQAFAQGGDIVIGSDAHVAQDVGEFSKAYDLATKVGFEADRIINRDKASVLRFLEGRKKRQIAID